MSKKIDIVLLIPGFQGWELWKGSREQGFQKAFEVESFQVSEMEKIPSGHLVMAFPVREALAIPFKVQTDDTAMFDDLAAMQLEKIGVRSEEWAGQLSDVFSAKKERGETLLLSAVISPPEEGTMPMRAPAEFDISARLFPMQDNAVTLWCELGRWVFAIKTGGYLTYFQSLAGTTMTAEAVRDVKLAFNQLRLQGVDVHVEKAVLWQGAASSRLSDEVMGEFSAALGLDVEIGEKPSPILPEKLSKIVPADVKAERKKKRDRLQRIALITVMFLCYLGVIGYFAYKYWKVNEDLKAQEEELQLVRLDHLKIGIFNDQWSQLEPVVDSRHWPLNILRRTAELIPNSRDLRFKKFDAKTGGVTIQGESGDIKKITAFGEKLTRALPEYEWNQPPSVKDKTGRRKFIYTGSLEGSEE